MACCHHRPGDPSLPFRMHFHCKLCNWIGTRLLMSSFSLFHCTFVFHELLSAGESNLTIILFIVYHVQFICFVIFYSTKPFWRFRFSFIFWTKKKEKSRFEVILGHFISFSNLLSKKYIVNYCFYKLLIIVSEFLRKNKG